MLENWDFLSTFVGAKRKGAGVVELARLESE